MKRLCSILESPFRAGTRAWFVLAWLAILFAAGSPAVKASAYVRADRLWTNGVVVYRWDSDISLFNRLRVLEAMIIWTNVANVRFVQRTSESDYVLIQNAPGSDGSRSDSIGRDGGVQNLYIRTNLSGVTPYGLAHEVGHVLGFYHSHQRPDRDKYITWFTNRTDSNSWGNFSIAATALGYPRDSMDYDSVMSYPRCVFSTCTGCGQFCRDCVGFLEVCRVLKIIDPMAEMQFDDAMGQREYLTRNDQLLMSFLYPQPNWRFVESGYGEGAERGTFHEPYFTAHKALTNVPNNSVLWVQPGSYRTGQNVVTKPLTLRAPLGGVVMRRN